jgi:hypothetical protein
MVDVGPFAVFAVFAVFDFSSLKFRVPLVAVRVELDH